jgi:GH25 family lysozyme M1 (1,4-beta-N-acetylmuramidase)
MTDMLWVDLYQYALNGKPDWPKVVAAGPPWHGAIIKASHGAGGTSQGQTDLAAWFQKQWPAIRAAAGHRYGVDFFRGGYHYLLAGVDGKSQAAHYLKRIENAGGWDLGDLWPIVDVEEGGNENRSKQEIVDAAMAFSETVRANTGRELILYGGYYLAKMGICDKLGCTWLWYPSYTATLPATSYERIGWKVEDLLAWQYVGDGNGKLAGYPTTTPIGAIDISAVTIAGGGDKALEWLRTNLRVPPKTVEVARSLRVTSPMMTGPDVLEVRRALVTLEYAAGAPDGPYDPSTAAAVCAFQRDHSLQIDGIVGPATRSALAATTQPAQPAPSGVGQRALAEAEKHVGLKEDPPGSGKTPIGEWFGVNGVAWSNIFVSYCFSTGAGYTIADNIPGGPAVGIYKGKGCTFVPTTEAWLRATGMWIGRTPPQPGDIAIYSWDGGIPDHIGIVVKDLGNGDFEAIEGNTSAGHDSNGGEVMRCVRHLSQVIGFGRVI